MRLGGVATDANVTNSTQDGAERLGSLSVIPGPPCSLMR